MSNVSDIDVPKLPVQEIHRLMTTELSLRSRLGYTALLLVALAATGVIASLWLTEPSLPMRTRIAFPVMVLIGLSWVVYAGWVLGSRRVLLAGHRVIAARMAVAFSGVFALGFLLLGFLDSGARAAFPAAGFGSVMLAVALGLLLHARRQFKRLLERRRLLELELARRG